MVDLPIMKKKKQSSDKDKDLQKYYPICSYCSQEIKKLNAYVIPLATEIMFNSFNALGLKRNRCIVTSCPFCRKVLGVYDFYEE